MSLSPLLTINPGWPCQRLLRLLIVTPTARLLRIAATIAVPIVIAHIPHHAHHRRANQRRNAGQHVRQRVRAGLIVQHARDRRAHRQRYRAQAQQEADALRGALRAADAVRHRAEQRNEAAIEQAHQRADGQQHVVRVGQRNDHGQQADRHERELLQVDAIDALQIGQIAADQPPDAGRDADAHDGRLLVDAREVDQHQLGRVHVRHKVADERHRNGERPDHVARLAPVLHVDQRAQQRDGPASRAARLLDGGRGRRRRCGRLGLAAHRPQRLVRQRARNDGQREQAEHEEGDAQIVLVDHVVEEERQQGRADAGAGRHEAVDDAQVAFEVVAENGEAGRVREGGAQAEHDAVGETEGGDAVDEQGGKEHAAGGEQAAEQRGVADADLVGEDAGEGGQEEGGADGQGADERWGGEGLFGMYYQFFGAKPVLD